MAWRITCGGEQWLVSPLARTVVSGTDCSEPEDVRTTGSGAGAVMDLRAHEEQNHFGLLHRLRFHIQMISLQTIF